MKNPQRRLAVSLRALLGIAGAVCPALRVAAGQTELARVVEWQTRQT